VISIPKLELYYDATTGQYLLQNYMEHPEFGYSVATGDFIYISADEMEKRGIDVVLDNLHTYSERSERTTSALERMSSQEERSFYRRHSVCGLSLQSPNVLTISPMEVEDDGAGQGDPSRRIHLNLPCPPDEFIAALNRAMVKRSG